MQTGNKPQSKTLGKTLAATALAGTALATAAWAQFGGGGPMPPPVAPPPPGAMPFPGPRPGSGNNHFPIAGGTVSAVDAGAGTITVTPRFGTGEAQTIKVANDAPISSQIEGSVSDLKVGDTVQVRGVPTGITASQITASDGADPSPFSPFGMGGPGGGRGGSATAQASGKITGLSPLTISVGAGVTVMLSAAPDVRVARVVSEHLSDIKVGDRVMANGQADDDGAFTAHQIRVNMDAGFGAGGRGMGGGRPAAENPRRTSPPPAPVGPQGGGASGAPVLPDGASTGDAPVQ